MEHAGEQAVYSLVCNPGETMQIQWSESLECYSFDTGELFVTMSPFGWYHGLTGMMYKSYPVNLVKPEKSFLNAEYYSRPGSELSMLPREISGGRRINHELLDDSVVVHFPPEREFSLGLDLCYSLHDDAIDMDVTINPGMDVPGFEIFFASYVCEALEETWVPLSTQDGSREWTKLNNRGKMNSIFGVMRSASLFGHLPSVYPDSQVEVHEKPFSEPILVARDPMSGLALVFLCDPHLTKYLAGQYHGWDTAHDWAFGTDLVAGEEVSARVRLICRRFQEIGHMQEEIAQLWRAFENRDNHSR